MRFLFGRRFLLRVLRRLPLFGRLAPGPLTALSFVLSYFMHPRKGAARRERIRRMVARRSARGRSAAAAEDDLARATVEQVA